MRRSATLKVEFDEADFTDEHLATSVQTHLQRTLHPSLQNVAVSVIEGGVCSGCGETGLFIHCGYCSEEPS
jgi:hypothetical protein